MAKSPRPEMSPPEASVLGDAVQHGVVKVGQWRLSDGEPIGCERLEAAQRLSRAGLLYPTGEQSPHGARRRVEEYVPTPRSRWGEPKDD